MKPDPTLIHIGMIVQLNPFTVGNKAFGACLMVVTEVKSWGVMGYVQALGDNRDTGGGQAYYRAEWDEFEPIQDNCPVWDADAEP